MTTEMKETAERETYSVMPYRRGGKFICFCTKIGYVNNSSGKRVQAWQYHGKSFADAQKAALQLAESWEQVIAEYRQRRTLHNNWMRTALASAAINGYYIDENDDKVLLDSDAADEAYRKILLEDAPALPVWPKGKTKTRQAIGTAMAVGAPTITLTEAKERYLKDYLARVGLQGRRGLKRKTYLTDSRALDITIRGNGKGEGQPIDPEIQVGQLSRQTIQQLVNWWLSNDRELSERTASNYLRTFKKFLDELGRMDVGYTKPDIADLFSFANPRGKIVKYDSKVVKALLANSPNPATKLYQMLSLNCGFYQVDICHLRPEEIVEVNGETFIGRKRDKTSHQNDFSTLWWLFPETVKLLKENMQKRGTLALVRPDGSGMYSKGKTSDDYVSSQFNKAREAADVKDFTFKQFRKIGISAIKRITGNPDIARMFAAQKIQGALGNYDRDDFFDPLTAALKKWHAELTADKVFD